MHLYHRLSVDVRFTEVQECKNDYSVYPITLIVRMTLFNYNDVIMSARDGVSNHQPHDCLLNRLFNAQIKVNIKAPLLLAFVRGIRRWPVNSAGDRWIPQQKASNAENVSIWCRHHAFWHVVPCHGISTHYTYLGPRLHTCVNCNPTMDK